MLLDNEMSVDAIIVDVVGLLPCNVPNTFFTC
jgi:hypothetical protein